MPFKSSARGAYGPQGQKVIKGPLAPVWSTSGTLTAGTSTQAYSFQLVATDDSGDAPTYSLASGSLPTGLSLSSSGLISGTPTGSGTSTFTVNATDVNGSTTTSSSLSINIAAAFTNYTLTRASAGSCGWGYGTNTDAIAFNFDKTVRVRGLSIYGQCSGTYTLNGNVQIIVWQGQATGPDNQIATTSVVGQTIQSGQNTYNELLFNSPVQLNANTWYTLGFTCFTGQSGMSTGYTTSGPQTSGSFSGSSGTVNWNSSTPTFGSGAYANNGTSHNSSGQLGQIYLQV